MKTFLLIHGSWHGAWCWHKIFPDRIERATYLESFMLPDGKRILDYVPDKDSKLTGHAEINRLALWDWLDPAVYEAALYADRSDDDVALARSLLTREPLRSDGRASSTFGRLCE